MYLQCFLLESIKYLYKGRTNQEETVHGCLICLSTIKNKYVKISNMGDVPQDRKKVQPSLFNPFELKNEKVKLSWSNTKSDISYNVEKCSNTKSSWSNIKLDALHKIGNSIKNKTSWCNIKPDSSYNIENNSSNNVSNNLDRASIYNKKEITTEGNKDEP